MAAPAAITSLIPSSSDPMAKSDLKAQSLRAQINDWASCPTTDNTTKKQIVGALSTQLSTVYTQIAKADQAKAQQNQTADEKETNINLQRQLAARCTGVGTNIDLSA